MGIRKIDYELCTGCGTCVENCPMDVIRLDPEIYNGETSPKAFIKYLRDCMTCYLCELECPEEAIYVSPERERRIPLPW